MSKQEQLDAATVLLKKTIGRLDRQAAEAGKEASEFCASGDTDTSAKLREIEARLRAAAAEATHAYSIGRGMSIVVPEGTIVAFGGGS